MHTQCAVYAPVALQTPHAVHSSTGGFSALFVAVLILLNLFFYGSSMSTLKICLIMCFYTVCKELIPSSNSCICLFII